MRLRIFFGISGVVECELPIHSSLCLTPTLDTVDSQGH
jgi:hypothetical protein